MAKVSELRNASLNIYKKHKLNSWILGIVCGLFSGAVIALNIVLPGLSFITVPFLVFPCIFACTLLHEAISEGIDLTLTNFLKYVGVFFRNPFNHSFNITRSFFKSFLIFLGTMFVSSFVVYAIYEHMYGEEFVNLYNLFTETLYDDTNIDIVQTLMFEDDNLLMQYFISTLEPGLFISSFAFIFFTSKDSIKIYLGVVLPQSNPSFIHQTIKRGVHTHSKEYYKYYFGLNWPLLLLMLIGFVGGRVLTGFVFNNPLMGVSVGVVFGFILSSFFFPFYFANNTVIYKQFENYFRNASKEIIEEFIERMERVTEINQEEREHFEKMMEDIGDPLSDNKEDNNKEDDQ